MTLLALAISALLWGCWASTQQADRKWRFELYAFDFAFGAMLTTLLLALTLGNWGGGNNFTFDDILTVAGKRNMATAAGSGVVYCLGNIMVLAGVALAGMSSALPVGMAMTLLIAVLLEAAFGTGMTNSGLAYGGAGLAILVLGVAALAQKAAAAAAPVKKGMHPGWKGFILSLVGGLLLASALRVAESSRGGDIGVGAYGVALFMSLGLFLMTPLVNVYFLNLPVQGQPASPMAYLKGTKKQHMAGMLGGALWAGGTVAFLAGVTGGYAEAPKFLSAEALACGSGVVGVLLGLAVMGDQAGAGKAKAMLLGAGAVLSGAITLVFLGA